MLGTWYCRAKTKSIPTYVKSGDRRIRMVLFGCRPTSEIFCTTSPFYGMEGHLRCIGQPSRCICDLAIFMPPPKRSMGKPNMQPKRLIPDE
jgi:hypothetical protein